MFQFDYGNSALPVGLDGDEAYTNVILWGSMEERQVGGG